MVPPNPIAYLCHLLVLFFLPFALISQSITPSVISSGGNFSTDSTGLSLTSTFGEYMVQKFENTNNKLILTQGFNQPQDYLYNSIFPINKIPNKLISIYPVPASDKLHIEILTKVNSQLELSVFSVEGKIVINQTYGMNESNSMVINLSELRSGLYMLRINSMNNDLIQTTPFIKL